MSVSYFKLGLCQQGTQDSKPSKKGTKDSKPYKKKLNICIVVF